MTDTEATSVRERIQTVLTERAILRRLFATNPGQQVSSSLFACAGCDTTYIDTDMHTCPRCDASVDEIPSDLEPGVDSQGA